MEKTILLLASLATALSATAQVTVFNDTFSGGSTLTNAAPAAPTANSTAYPSPNNYKHMNNS